MSNTPITKSGSMTDAEVIRRHYYAILEARKCIATDYPDWARGWVEIAGGWRELLRDRRYHELKLRKAA